MECDVLIEVVNTRDNSGGHTQVDGVKVHYGEYSDLKSLKKEINETNYSNYNYISKAFIVTLDLDKLK